MAYEKQNFIPGQKLRSMLTTMQAASIGTLLDWCS